MPPDGSRRSPAPADDRRKKQRTISSTKEATIYCPNCGQPIGDPRQPCSHCSHQVRPVQVDESLSSWIPYKNPAALIAYYLGIFAFIPCFGFFLGIPAVIAGILGLKSAKRQPEVKGKVHAWLGIIFGTFFTLLYLSVILMVVFAMSQHKK